MTRREWYEHYRKLRVDKKKSYKGLTYSTLNEMFKEHYTHILYGKDQVKYDLIEKYEDRVSPRLLYEKKLLREKSKVQGDQMWKELLETPSPLFKNLSKDNIWTSSCILGVEHGVTFSKSGHHRLWK